MFKAVLLGTHPRWSVFIRMWFVCEASVSSGWSHGPGSLGDTKQSRPFFNFRVTSSLELAVSLSAFLSWKNVRIDWQKNRQQPEIKVLSIRWTMPLDFWHANRLAMKFNVMAYVISYHSINVFVIALFLVWSLQYAQVTCFKHETLSIILKSRSKYTCNNFATDTWLLIHSYI